MTPLEIEQLRRALDERDLEPEYRRQIMQRMSAGAVPVTGGPPNEMQRKGVGTRELAKYVQAGRGADSPNIYGQTGERNPNIISPWFTNSQGQIETGMPRMIGDTIESIDFLGRQGMGEASHQTNPYSAGAAKITDTGDMYDAEGNYIGNMLENTQNKILSSHVVAADLGPVAAGGRLMSRAATGQKLAQPDDFVTARMGAGEAPKKYYHVVSDDYKGGPLKTLRSQFDNDADAIDAFRKKWPDAGDPAIVDAHMNQIFFYDNADEAIQHQKHFGGKILEVDPEYLDIKIDKLENEKGWPFTSYDVDEKALKLSELNSPSPRYPDYLPTGKPALADKKTNKIIQENFDWTGPDQKLPKGTYLKKMHTPEEAELMSRRQAAYDRVKAGDYEPYFKVEDRFPVDYSKYPDRPKTIDVAQPVATYKSGKPRPPTNAAIKAQDPNVRARLQQLYDLSKYDEGAVDWYFLGQLEQNYLKEFGEKEGRRRFQNLADLMAATTNGMTPETNIRAAAYANFMHEKGLEASPTSWVAEKNRRKFASWEVPAGIGGGKHGIAGRLYSADEYWRNPEEALDAFKHPKKLNFSKGFLGYADEPVLDEQMSVAMQWPKGAFHGGDYGPFESVAIKFAQDEGITPQRAQEVVWASIKKLLDPSYTKGKPAIQSLNEILAANSYIQGISQERILKGFMRGSLPIFGLGGAMLFYDELGRNMTSSERQEQ